MTELDSEFAPLAVTENNTRGRRHAEGPAGDDPFEIDRGRVIQCTAFRRLMYKTQVFIQDVRDHYRTRLTHTIEVAAQARRLARRLGLNASLAEAVALAHDLGHPPFGHAGEAALDACMADHGGFEHNVQSLRVVDYLEHPYPEFRGLNLSFELRESLVKHRTEYDRPPPGSTDEATGELLAAGPCPPLEGQVVNLADAIAYTLHDIEDGIGQKLLDAGRLAGSSIWRDAAADFDVGRSPDRIHAVRRPILDRIADRLVADAAEASAARIRSAAVRSLEDVRRNSGELVAFSDATGMAVRELQGLLRDAVYRNPRVSRMDDGAKPLVAGLFGSYAKDPDRLPERFADRIADQGVHRVVCDYVAGMTDRFCREEHRKLGSGN